MRGRHRAVVFLWLAAGCGGNAAGVSGPGPADARVSDAAGGVVDAGVVAVDAPLSSVDAAVDAPLGSAADARPSDAPLAGDAGAADARVLDARLPDARPPDARLPDARVADARADGPTNLPDAGCGPLEMAIEEPYLVHASGSSTVVSDAVSGTGPFTCTFFNGFGAGTRPDGLTLTGATCTLNGGGGGTPGQYGFIVVVRDACNHTVDVPVAFDNGDCPGNASLDPSPWPPRVPADPTGGYAWTLEAAIGVRNFDNMCQACFGMSMSTRSPTTLATSLDCDNPGDLCSDCDGCIEPIHAGCSPPQSSLAMSRELTVRAHDALRAGPGWLTMGVSMVFSSQTDQTCAAQEWACHVEVLEP